MPRRLGCAWGDPGAGCFTQRAQRQGGRREVGADMRRSRLSFVFRRKTRRGCAKGSTSLRLLYTVRSMKAASPQCLLFPFVHILRVFVRNNKRLRCDPVSLRPPYLCALCVNHCSACQRLSGTRIASRPSLAIINRPSGFSTSCGEPRAKASQRRGARPWSTHTAIGAAWLPPACCAP